MSALFWIVVFTPLEVIGTAIYTSSRKFANRSLDVQRSFQFGHSARAYVLSRKPTDQINPVALRNERKQVNGTGNTVRVKVGLGLGLGSGLGLGLGLG